MKADPFTVGEILKDTKRFVVPIYQRSYAWPIKPQLETFFDQVEAKAKEHLDNETLFPHYVGAILVMPRGAFAFGRIVILDVVDGQQRLTTFQLLLAALKDLAVQYELPTANLIDTYLVNPAGAQLQEPEERYKLYPSYSDRQLFCDIIDLSRDKLRERYPDSFYKNLKVVESSRLPLRAWGYFRTEAETFINLNGEHGCAERFNALLSALLEHFRAIVITLGERDDAQVIFETLNAGGKPLAAMDLVRNDVFHRAVLKGENVDTLFEQRWSKFEDPGDPFWKEEGNRGRIRKPCIDFFLNDTLACETGREVLLTELYAQYKKFVLDRQFQTVDSELATFLKYAPIFRVLADPAGDSSLAELARALGVLDVSTANPLIFLIGAAELGEDEKRNAYQLVESFLVRRMLCGLTAKKYNSVFLQIVADLRSKGITFANLVEAFARLNGPTMEFPGDVTFRRALRERSQYGSIPQPRLRYVLARLEYQSRNKFDEATELPDDLQIEHVLPDTWQEHWFLPDGAKAPEDRRTGLSEQQLKWVDERESLKNTIGNLTLLNYARNPSVGNDHFTKKQGKYAQSLLKLNQEIASFPDWSEARIRQRSDRLADLAIKVWPDLPQA